MPDPVHGKHISVEITKDGRNSLGIPAGEARKVMFNNGLNDPVYVAFGDKSIAASDQSIRIDFGYSEIMIPDGATTMGFYATVDRGLVVAFAFLGKPLLDKPSPLTDKASDDDDLDDFEDDPDPPPAATTSRRKR